MAIVFISITQVFIDVGFTSGIVQLKDIKAIAYSPVFYFNLLIGFFVLIIIITAALISIFYEKPKTANILLFLTIITTITANNQLQNI